MDGWTGVIKKKWIYGNNDMKPGWIGIISPKKYEWMHTLKQ